MKTKIGLPLGLALVMFIGVFTTMLALGALNPQPVGAAPDSVSSVERSDNTVNAIADWTITVENDDDAIADGGTIEIVFTDHNVGNDCAVNEDDTAVCREDNWEVNVPMDGTAEAIPVDVDSVVVASGASVTITVGTEIPANREFTLKFFAEKSRGGEPIAGITNPNNDGADELTVGGEPFSITTFAEAATIADDPMPTVTRSDNRVGAYAKWTITAETDDTNPIQIGNTIAIVFTDQDVGADCDSTTPTDVCTVATDNATHGWFIDDGDVATIESVSVDEDTKTVRIVTAAGSIAVDTEFTITFTPPAPRRAYGIRPPR